VKEGTYAAGKDFELKSGRLRLNRDFGVHATSEHEDPFLGIENRTVEIGLDERGQGKFKRVDTFVGVAYLIVPLAVRESREVRFLRLDDE
jgi:hypothetical protein